MSRPKNPDWVVDPFAPDLQYPGAPNAPYPWSGSPTKVAWAGAPSVGFTPRMSVPAQALNHVLSSHADALLQSKGTLDSLTDLVGQIQVLNWKPLQQLDTTLDPLSAFYSELERAWYVAYYSVVQDETYLYNAIDDNTLVTQALAPGSVWGGDADDQGNIILSLSTRYVYRRSGGVWSQVDAVGAAHSTDSSRVVYDPVHARWILVSNDTGGVVVVRTSADAGATWQAQSVGALGSGVVRIVIKKSNGLVLVANNTGGVLNIVASSDGGVTWTLRASNLSSTASYTYCDLDYDPALDMWVARASTGVTSTTKVWTSTDDGVTWTLRSNLTAAALGRVLADGYLWVSDLGGDLVYSTDLGTTWRYAGVNLGALYIAKGGGGFLALAADKVYASLRAGLPGVAVLT